LSIFAVRNSIMPNHYFQFKQFTIQQDRCAMKITTDACLFGAWIARQAATGRVLDIGTGTGLLSLMLAQQQEVLIDAVEIDAAAAEQAAANSASSPWAGRIQVVNDDIRNWHPTQRYDTIITNPPFYETDLKSADAGRNAAHHSSHLSLADLLQAVRNNITAEGRLFLLLPYNRLAAAIDLLMQFGFYCSHQLLVRQTPAHGFFRVMLCCVLQLVETTIEEITITEADRTYTVTFTQLLQPYYLYL
jgi:tRNA1Val (adenine37-N6)-methyltransferase